MTIVFKRKGKADLRTRPARHRRSKDTWKEGSAARELERTKKGRSELQRKVEKENLQTESKDLSEGRNSNKTNIESEGTEEMIQDTQFWSNT